MDLIRLVQGESAATIAPWRGGIVTSFVARGRELLYLDQATFDDPSANVRGGVPVLFPTPGKLVDDTWSRGGKSGRLKQHGFARNLAWELVDRDDASARLRLGSTPETRASYPWDFTFDLRCLLEGAALRLELAIENRSSEPMPFGAGFHPYFRLADADKARAVVPTDARRAFDNRAKQEIDLVGIDLTSSEVDLHLHGHTASALELFDGPRHLAVRASPELSQWVVWTLRGRDFVCLEPWTSPGNAMNTGERLVTIAPGEVRSMWVTIDCVA